MVGILGIIETLPKPGCCGFVEIESGKQAPNRLGGKHPQNIFVRKIQFDLCIK